jgi:hypothetical protein
MSVKSLVRELLPRRHVAHRVMTGPLRGMRIVTSWHDYPAAIFGYTERKLTDWLLANAGPGETWLDVGANCGYTSLAGAFSHSSRHSPRRPASSGRDASTASISLSPCHLHYRNRPARSCRGS